MKPSIILLTLFYLGCLLGAPVPKSEGLTSTEEYTTRDLARLKSDLTEVRSQIQEVRASIERDFKIPNLDRWLDAPPVGSQNEALHYALMGLDKLLIRSFDLTRQIQEIRDSSLMGTIHLAIEDALDSTSDVLNKAVNSGSNALQSTADALDHALESTSHALNNAVTSGSITLNKIATSGSQALGKAVSTVSQELRPVLNPDAVALFRAAAAQFGSSSQSLINALPRLPA
jgi:hypothetical protein